MDHYYILRNNQESGPFTVKELKAEGLYGNDLVWLDGESNAWKYPAEFDELKSFIRAPRPAPQQPPKLRTFAPPEVEWQPQRATVAAAVFPADTAAVNDWKMQEEEILAPPSFEALKQKHTAKVSRRRAWKQPINIAANLFGLGVFVVGVMMVAVVLKKAVDSIDFEQTEETADARPLESETLEPSTASHAALAMVGPPAAPAATLIVPKKDSAEKKAPPVKIQQEISVIEPPAVHNTTDADADTMQSTKAATGDEETKLAAVQPEDNSDHAAAEEKAAKSASEALQVSANDYSVGLFGGVSNLELTINNPSSRTIEKALVEVDFLKPNGKVVHTQTVEVASIAAGGSRKVAVPNSSRGVKVRYRVSGL